MKLVSFRTEDRVRAGILEDDEIVVLRAPTMLAYIALAPAERLKNRSGERFALCDVTLEAPVIPSRNAFCIGRNYLDHVKEIAGAFGRDVKLPQVPTIFTKAPSAIAAPNATLHLQARVSNEYDFEAELAIVIGERCKDVSEDLAMSVIFGYTCANDVTARDLQHAHGQWFKGKSLDDTCPLGPAIVTADEIADPHALAISMRVNGVEKQHSSTGNMIFHIPRIVAELSKGMTLEPGDVLLTGTPNGVGFARTPPEFLADGDTMDVTIERIGTLHNTVEIR